MPTLNDYTPPSSSANNRQDSLFALACAAAASAPSKQYASAPSQGANDLDDVNECIQSIAENDKHFDPFLSDDDVEGNGSGRRLNFSPEQHPTSTLRVDRNDEKVNCFYFCSP